MTGMELTYQITKVDYREFFKREGKQQSNHHSTIPRRWSSWTNQIRTQMILREVDFEKSIFNSTVPGRPIGIWR